MRLIFRLYIGLAVVIGSPCVFLLPRLNACSVRSYYCLLRLIGLICESTGTKYNIYRHSKTLEYIVRTLEYSLPRSLRGHVDVVTPTTYFGTMRSMKATSFLQPTIKSIESDIEGVGAPSCDIAITPSCLRMLYKTAFYKPKATKKNLLGIAGYLEQYANYADLQVCVSFFAVLALPLKRSIRLSSVSSAQTQSVGISPLCWSTVAWRISPSRA